MKKQKVLIVDDSDNFRESLAENLQLTDRYLPLQAPGAGTALAIVQGDPEIACIILDYDLRKGGTPRMSGLEMMEELDRIAPHIPVIMISGITQGRGGVAAKSIRKHAIAFLDKPFATTALLDLLEQTIGRGEEDSSIADAQRRLADAGFITRSPLMARVCLDALRAAEQDDGHILLVGETGVGKDVLARAIHTLSPRSDEPFVVENCATIGKDLFNSILFGQVRGAFTDAVDKQGLLQMAGKGMMFLDELTEMPIDVQPGLLRAIDSREFRRLGENTVQRFEARIIAATNRAVAEAIRDGHLRGDLRYRFERIILIPPLRERSEDIPAIVEAFLGTRSVDGASLTIDGAAMATLQRQPWLGNVRQLLHVLRRAAADAERGHITHDVIAGKLREEYGIEGNVMREETYEIHGDLDTTMELLRRRYIVAALWRSGGKIAPAAASLGYATREGLKYWLEKYGIDPGAFAGPPASLNDFLERYASTTEER